MVVSKDLVLLATANKIHIVNDKGEESLISFSRHEHGLFSNHAGTALYCLPLGKAKKVSLPEGRKAGKKLFKTWHGFEVNKGIKVSIPDKAATLFKCGYALSVLYTSHKWDGKPKQYIHDFKGKIRAYCDRPVNPRTFGLMSVNGKGLVTARGIVG